MERTSGETSVRTLGSVLCTEIEVCVVLRVQLGYSLDLENHSCNVEI